MNIYKANKNKGTYFGEVILLELLLNIRFMIFNYFDFL